MIENLPPQVAFVLNHLNSLTDAYLVGGCVRDHLLGRTPKDYDIATKALPGHVRRIFAKVIPTGERYGTVTVMVDDTAIEVTTYRTDGNYSDGRRPDVVTFGTSIEEDLSRRDFTVNAMAWSPVRGLVDPFGGLTDLQTGLIRAVGNPAERFQEDALRMLRAIRFATVLGRGFILDLHTGHQIQQNAPLIRNVSPERIREELNRILLSRNSHMGLTWLWAMGLLPEFMPELAKCRSFDQHNPHHFYDVFEHIKRVVEAVPQVLHLRLAALLHDIAKPETFTMGEDGIGHFYGHDERGAQMAQDILERLKYDRATIDRVVHLVREHMFPDNMGAKAIRRFIARVGADHIPDLLQLRLADIAGSGTEHDTSHVQLIRTILEDMQEQGVADPTTALTVNGRDVMEVLGIGPGPRVGEVLRDLVEKITDQPELNHRWVLLEILDLKKEPRQ